MARIISYPVLSTVSSEDWIPITDTSATGNPLKNVTVGDLQSFIVQGATLQSVVTAGNTYQTDDTLWRLRDTLTVFEGTLGASMQPGAISVNSINSFTGLKAGIIAFTNTNGFSTRVRQYDILDQNTDLQWPKRSGILALIDDIVPSPWGEPIPGGPIIFPPPFSAPSRVGINNADPLEALDVTGNILATGKVEAPNFYGQLNGSINNGTTGYTQSSTDDSAKIATTAFVNNAIAAVPSGLTFKGSWDATLNVPTLPILVPANGDFWIVSVAGTTNLGGITSWDVGDWAISVYSGGAQTWQKIDNSSVLTGTGTGQMIAKWDGAGTSLTLTDSVIAEDNGKIGVGVISPIEAKLEVIETTANIEESIGIKTKVLNTNTNAGITASTYGLQIDTETAQAVGSAGNNQAIRANAIHSGISDVSFVVGANITAEIDAGGGPNANVYGSYIDSNVNGNVTSESKWFIGSVAVARIGNPSHTVNYDFMGAAVNLEPKSGACSRDTIILNVNAVDAGVFTVAGDYAFLRLEDGLPPTVAGTSRAISSETALPSVFAGSLESTAFIKTSGTALEFLMADGSVSTGAFTGNIPATQITFGNAASNGITSSSDFVFDDSFKTLTITGTSAFGNTVIKDTSILVEQDASTSVGLSINANAPRVGFTLGNVSTYLNVPTVPTQENIISLPDKSGTVALLDDIGAGTVNGGGLTGYVPLWTSTSDIGISGMFQLGDNVGIGTLQPAAQLETTEDILVNGLTVGIGSTIYLPTDGNYENSRYATAVGHRALASNTTGLANTAFGHSVLENNTESFYNTAMGSGAMRDTISADRCVAIGGSALIKNGSVVTSNPFDGHRNTAVGHISMVDNISGMDNTAVGADSMGRNVSGNYNTAIGLYAMHYSIDGDSTVAVGSAAGTYTPNGLDPQSGVTRATNGVFIGKQTRPLNTISSNEIIIGAFAEGLGNNSIVIGREGNHLKTRLHGKVGIGTNFPTAQIHTTEDILVHDVLTVGLGATAYVPGDANYPGVLKSTAVGNSALANNLYGTSNTAIGFSVLKNNVGNVADPTRGSANVGVGLEALINNTEGRGNTAVGYFSLQYNTGASPVTSPDTGSGNAAFGGLALNRNRLGNYNTGSGFSSMYYNQDGDYNVALGFSAGQNWNNTPNPSALSNSTEGIFIGAKSKAFANDSVNEIVIGYDANGLGSNTTVLGNTNITKTRIYGDIDVATGDVEVADNTKGLILSSPDGTRYRVTVANGGTLTVTAV
mgnify:FL=1